MIPNLLKARAVLTCKKAGQRVVFESSVYDEDEEPRIVVGMAREMYAEMGSPQEITVTVERGDTLN